MTNNKRLSIWSLAIVLLAFAVLVALGGWQLQRLAWKEALIAKVEAQMSLPAAPLPETLDDPASWDFRRVSLAGEYLHGDAAMLYPRVKNGKPGYHLLTPFRRVSGGIVIIDRGWTDVQWVPEPAGLTQIEGVARVPVRPRHAPENVPIKAMYYWPDVNALAREAQLDTPLPLVVHIPLQPEGVYPAGSAVVPDMPNNHRQYAAFWFTMAGVMLVMFALFCYSGRKEEKRVSYHGSL